MPRWVWLHCCFYNFLLWHCVVTECACFRVQLHQRRPCMWVESGLVSWHKLWAWKQLLTPGSQRSHDVHSTGLGWDRGINVHSKPERRDCMQILQLFPYLSVCASRVCVTYWGTETLGKWCLTMWRTSLVFSDPKKWNRRWRGCDVIIERPPSLQSHVRSYFFFCHFFFSPAPWCLAYFYSVSVCIFPSILISFVARRWSRRSLAVVRLSFFLFFYEWDVLFTPCAISVPCADDEHKVWPHHFLLCYLASSYWLRFSSQR